MKYGRILNGYEGLYQVSNYGRVKRLSYKRKNPLTNTVSTFKEHLLKTNLKGKVMYID